MQSRNLPHFLSDRKDLAYVAYICLACFVLGIAAIAWPVLRDNGFPLDDSWIHQVVGRNAAMFGVPGFAPGVASSGSSSAIWPWIVALNYRFFPSLDHIIYLFTLNSILLLVIACILFSLAARDGLPPLEVGIFAALPLLTGNVVWLTSIGMEHLLFVAASFAAAYFWLSPKGVRRLDRSIGAGVCCGLAIVSRPEAVAFIPIFLLAAWPLRKSPGELIAFSVPCALAIVLVLLDNLWTSGSVLPTTFGGRKWLYFYDTHDSALVLAGKLLIDSGIHMVRYFFGIAAGTYSNFVAFAVAMFAVMAGGVLRLVKLKAWRIIFLLALTAANVGTYCIMLPNYGQGMRYLAMSLFFVFPLFALGVLELVERIAAGLKVSPVAGHRVKLVAALMVALVGLTSLLAWSQITDLGIKHINATNVRMGKWLAANLPPTMPVASFDIGGIGYFGNRRIIDLGGLSDAGFTPYLVANQTAAYLKEHGIQWLVLPMGFADPGSGRHDACEWFKASLSLCYRPEMTMQEMTSFATAEPEWKVGFLALHHAAPSQVLYRISWH